MDTKKGGKDLERGDIGPECSGARERFGQTPDEDSPKRLGKITFAADTGAFDHVLPEEELPGYEVEES